MAPAFPGLPAGSAPLTWTPAPLAAAPPPASSPASASSPTADLTQPGSGWTGEAGVPGGAGGLNSGGDLGGLGGLAGRIVAAMGDLLGSAGNQPADDLFDDETDDWHEPDPLKEPEEPEKSESARRHGEHVVPASQPISQAGPESGLPGSGPPPAGPPTAEPPTAGPPTPSRRPPPRSLTRRRNRSRRDRRPARSPRTSFRRRGSDVREAVEAVPRRSEPLRRRLRSPAAPTAWSPPLRRKRPAVRQ